VRLQAHGRTVDIRWDDPDDWIPRRIQETGDFYERGLLDDIYKRAPQGLIVDVGAHIGNHTLWFAGVMNQQVVAFEPEPSAFAQLVSNVERNGLDCFVSVERMALGAKQADGQMTEPNPGNTGSRAVVRGDGSVTVAPLDRFALVPAAIKIDVEGSAHGVLLGARETLKHRPLLYIETADELAQIDALLGPLGYRRFGPFGASPVYGYEAA
jgi:FkbM family methyltransferase